MQPAPFIPAPISVIGNIGSQRTTSGLFGWSQEVSDNCFAAFLFPALLSANVLPSDLVWFYSLARTLSFSFLKEMTSVRSHSVYGPLYSSAPLNTLTSMYIFTVHITITKIIPKVVVLYLFQEFLVARMGGLLWLNNIPTLSMACFWKRIKLSRSLILHFLMD